MIPLYVHDDARKDLEDLWRTDSVAAADIVAVLEELTTNDDLRSNLLDHKYGSDRSAQFEVQKWVSQWNQGRDLWRLKIWGLEDLGIQYRIIYAYSVRQRSYHVLGIVHRDFNYDESHPVSQRIIRAYRNL